MITDQEDRRSRRITDLMLGYWNIIKGGRKFPDIDDVQPKDIADLWDFCFLVKVVESGRFRYEHFGMLLEEAYGAVVTNDDSPPLPSPHVERLAAKYDEVLRTRAPVVEEDSFVNAKGRTVRYRQILLPIGGSGTAISHILGAMRFKIYDTPAPEKSPNRKSSGAVEPEPESNF